MDVLIIPWWNSQEALTRYRKYYDWVSTEKHIGKWIKRQWGEVDETLTRYWESIEEPSQRLRIYVKKEKRARFKYTEKYRKK